MLDRWIEGLKKISVITSLLAGAGLLFVYFCGIAAYLSLRSVLGIEPFPFRLAECLEEGALFITRVMLLLPSLVILGFFDIFTDRAGITQFLLLVVVPFILLQIYARRLVMRRHAAQFAAIVCLLGCAAMILFVYHKSFTDYQSSGLLFDPAVNLAIKHKSELTSSAELEKLGISHLDSSVLPLIKGDLGKYLGKIGRFLWEKTAFLLAAWLALRLARQFQNKNSSGSAGLNSALNVVRSGLGIALSLVSIAILILFIARIVLGSFVSSRPKVDVSIPGVEIARSSYLALVSESDEQYAFYMPRDQSLLFLPKKSVGRYYVRGHISLFADRSQFLKGTWLGVETIWAPRLQGYVVTNVVAGSPSHRAGVQEADIITSIAGKSFDGSRPLHHIVEELPTMKMIPLELHRDNSPLTLMIVPP